MTRARADVPATKRRKLTRGQRIKVWEKGAGICVLCKQPIDKVKQPWLVEHIIPLEMGGKDILANMGPAHVIPCARDKTKKDQADLAQMRKRKAREIGTPTPSKTPMSAGRKSDTKRTMDGKTVDRPSTRHKSHLADLPRRPMFIPEK